MSNSHDRQLDAAVIEGVLAVLTPRLKTRSRGKADRLFASLSELSERMHALRAEKRRSTREKLTLLHRSFESAVEARQRRDADTSPALNSWEVLGLVDSEISHSAVLAWLLDRTGSHAQGSLFLREWIHRTVPEATHFLEAVKTPYRVRTEVRHSRSRIDIEVMGDTFVMHIECKINAEEGVDQTCREREDLKAKARSRGLTEEQVLAFYLTTDGAPCSDKEVFRPLAWTEVVEIVDRSAQQIRQHRPTNTHLPWLLKTYGDVLRKYVVRSQ
jgi:hypothetical protein